MRKIKIATEKLWARNKYDIMAKGYDNYSCIKTMFKNADNNDDYYTIYEKLVLMRKLPYTKKAIINTLEHTWGYFKKKASLEEKQLFFQLLEDLNKSSLESFISMPSQVEKVMTLIVLLAEKYEETYLLNSNFLFPQLLWNEVQLKKEISLITASFYEKT
jgi:uncharacterized protein YbgA (DUF1722 family)